MDQNLITESRAHIERDAHADTLTGLHWRLFFIAFAVALAIVILFPDTLVP